MCNRVHYVRKMEDFITRHWDQFDNKDLVVCWSGGKDSTAILLLMSEVARNLGISLSAVFVPYPNATVDQSAFLGLQEFWTARGIQFKILRHNQEDPTVPFHEVCGVCKQVRRDVLVQEFFSCQTLERITILTGHNTWDLAAYICEMTTYSMMSGGNQWIGERYERYLEVMNKFLPVFQHKEGPVIARPFINLDEDDSRKVIELFDVPFPFAGVPNPCPWSRQRKRVLHSFFELSKLHFTYEDLCAYARQHIPWPDRGEYDQLPFPTYLL